MTQDTASQAEAREVLANPNYLADRFEWAAPGDQQEDAWLVRFCDNDVRDMIFTGADAEKEAWAAWERHAPGYNMYVFRLAALAFSRSPREKALEEALGEAAGVLEAAASTLEEGDAARLIFEQAAKDARAKLEGE